MKTRAAFCLITTPLTRISRHLCKDILKPLHAVRNPFVPINVTAIKVECQNRLAGLKDYAPVIKPKPPTTLNPVVARLGIDITVPTPAILLRYHNNSESGKMPTQQAMNPSTKMMNVGLQPSIMRKRGYEQSNGIDAASPKRPNMSVIRQAGNVLRQQGIMRGNMVNNHMNGRSRNGPPKSLKMQMISWVDAPDDVYFVSTDATRKLRKQMNTMDFRKAARNPWRSMRIRPPRSTDIVVLDWSNIHRTWWCCAHSITDTPTLRKIFNPKFWNHRSDNFSDANLKWPSVTHWKIFNPISIKMVECWCYLGFHG